MNNWMMPAEWAEQERVWLAYPRDNYTIGDEPVSREAAYATWAAVANAIIEFEPVTAVVDPSSLADAKKRLDPRIEILEAALDDSWMRDIGPTFVLDSTGELGAVDWTFNGWGANLWSMWERDREIAKFVSDAAGSQHIPSTMVNEGGGIHVDGEGTVLVTETVQLDPFRNPYLTKERVEWELNRTIGATKAIWLPRGLHRDYGAPGTRGHVDMVACFAKPGVVLLHWQSNPEHPDHALSVELEKLLLNQTDAAGRRLQVVRVEAPAQLKDEHGFVDFTYINHLVVNGGVIACGFGDPEADQRAAEVLAEAYGRRVVTIDAREIFIRGGGIHCITQQQPKANPKK
jgi:agmatine deiminase